MFCSCLEIVFFLAGRHHSQFPSLPDENETNKSSDSPPTVFSSLPDDIILNCLARVSRFYRPSLSLVNKEFQSLIASPDLEATRSRIGVTENHLYVCLESNKNNPNPRWFTLAPIPKEQKVKPIIPSFPYQHPTSSTFVSIGSEIYIIGGFVKRKRSRRVLVLDCRSHQCRRLPNMALPRVSAAADVIDGKIYVVGGSKSKNIDNWGEVFDPETQTWEPIFPTTVDLTTQKSVFPGKLVMGGKVYDMDGLKVNLNLNSCVVEIDNMMCQISVCKGILVWYDSEEDLVWNKVRGLEGLLPRNSYFPCYLVSVANHDRGRRVTVWWQSMVFDRLGLDWTKEGKTEIWCAEISLERRGFGELWGFVEWSKKVFTYDGCDSPSDFFLHSAIVTY
ncbi:Kelch repeat type 1 [Arabidopsis thaliana x Arabidopsis arenosa]|uniref:Kelch repeat type 1 n=1 Tax=Arabidopsis thaliana x Arabidopsis arenosa TaxID=1240361 RepID=A0A8T2CNA3_9BRAS|nr:Kelch repeat type 1 [Arabidopsis thaliana x Arabidopsis arenosa]